MIRRVLLAVALTGAAVLAGCEEPAQPEIETAPPPMEAPIAPPPTETPATPADDGAMQPPPPIDPSTLPEDQRESAETVQPESETLFY